MIRATLPALTLLVACLIAVLPFGAGEIVRNCAAFVPVIVAHYWSARRPGLLPVTLVFACGLAIDVLTNGPIGFWSFAMLTSSAFARLEEVLTGQSTVSGRAAVHAIAMVSVAALAWAIASAYNGQSIDGQPLLLAALVSIAAYPVFALLLMPIDRLWETQRLSLFSREGSRVRT